MQFNPRQNANANDVRRMLQQTSSATGYPAPPSPGPQPPSAIQWQQPYASLAPSPQYVPVAVAPVVAPTPVMVTSGPAYPPATAAWTSPQEEPRRSKSEGRKSKKSKKPGRRKEREYEEYPIVETSVHNISYSTPSHVYSGRVEGVLSDSEYPQQIGDLRLVHEDGRGVYRRPVKQVVERPVAREVQVPIMVKEQITTTERHPVVVKKLVEEQSWKTVQQPYTEVVPTEKTRMKEVWVKQLVPEKYIVNEIKQGTRNVTVPTTVVREVEEVQEVERPVTKVIEKPSFKTETVVDKEVVEVDGYEDFELVPRGTRFHAERSHVVCGDPSCGIPHPHPPHARHHEYEGRYVTRHTTRTHTSPVPTRSPRRSPRRTRVLDVSEEIPNGRPYSSVTSVYSGPSGVDQVQYPAAPVEHGDWIANRSPQPVGQMYDPQSLRTHHTGVVEVNHFGGVAGHQHSCMHSVGNPECGEGSCCCCHECEECGCHVCVHHHHLVHQPTAQAAPALNYSNMPAFPLPPPPPPPPPPPAPTAFPQYPPPSPSPAFSSPTSDSAPRRSYWS
eukprot:TRINITY_DN53918_c0_g1_i1.p1 TRINITY_DN53918_c0_g1~~TRINITY_DN53918_c0_g1_i1.p1  ORF type:complete len:556 (+),score=58.21 TRINITY_DN53918_c0_g1_i1:85-1752(+)